MTSATSPVSLASPASFDFQPRTRLVFGANSVEKAGELIRDLFAGHGEQSSRAGRKILLVTDSGIVRAGHAAKLQKILEAAGVAVTVFDRVIENPTSRCVQDCVETAKTAGINAFVALGGGSSMDTAKGCNFVLTNGGAMRDYRGVGKATRPMLPLLAIPTTAGTGSECQSFALICDDATHQKMACGDPKAAAAIAILDPLLTFSQPARVTACTGIDAIAHAVESAVATTRNACSLMYSHEAFRLMAPSLSLVLKRPQDLEARSRMQLGAAFAGMAIENSMLGAAHAAANPLTAHYDIPHGQAVGLMLPHVVRFNGKDSAALEGYVHLAWSAGLAPRNANAEEGLKGLVAHLESLLGAAEMPASLTACGVKASAVPSLAEEAAGQWTAGFNPRQITAQDFRSLYEAAMRPRT